MLEMIWNVFFNPNPPARLQLFIHIPFPVPSAIPISSRRQSHTGTPYHIAPIAAVFTVHRKALQVL